MGTVTLFCPACGTTKKVPDLLQTKRDHKCEECGEPLVTRPEAVAAVNQTSLQSSRLSQWFLQATKRQTIRRLSSRSLLLRYDVLSTVHIPSPQMSLEMMNYVRYVSAPFSESDLRFSTNRE